MVSVQKERKLASGIHPRRDVLLRLEKAVLEVFSEQDFHQADMREVVARSGVSLRTIYKHYDSKENLVFSFIGKWMGDFSIRLDEVLRKAPDIKSKFRAAHRLQYEYYAKNPAIGKILFITVPAHTWMSHETYENRLISQKIMELAVAGQRAGVINPSLRPSSIYDLSLAILIRVFGKWVYHGKKYKLEEEGDIWFELFWRAVALRL